MIQVHIYIMYSINYCCDLETHVVTFSFDFVQDLIKTGTTDRLGVVHRIHS